MIREAASSDVYVTHFTTRPVSPHQDDIIEHTITHEFDRSGNHRLASCDGPTSPWTWYQGIARLEHNQHVYLGFTGFFGEEVIEGRSLVASRNPCHTVVIGTQNLCTRQSGHEGEHRCKASDVDARL